MALVRTRPAAAAANLRHEYAHHELGDVVQARITLWLPWTLAAMVLLVVALPQPAAWRPVMIGTAPRTLLLVTLMFMARASFLRAREIAADHEARAPRYDELVAFLNGVPDPPAWWRRPFASHPTREWRQAAVRSPAAACRVGVGDGVTLGLVTAASTTVVTSILANWNNWQPANLADTTVTWALLGAGLGWWVAAMVTRLAGASRFGEPVTPVRFAIGVGAGVAVGGFILLGQPGSPGITFGYLTMAASALLGATAGALVGWIWSVAQWWMNLELADRGANWTERGVQVVGLLAGMSLMGAASLIQQQMWAATDHVEIFLFRRARDGFSGYDLMAVLVVIGLPVLLMRQRRRSTGGVPGWLSTAPRTDAVPAAPEIRTGLSTAVVGGLIATSAYVVATAVWSATVPHPASWYFALVEAQSKLLAPSAVLAATVAAAAARARSCRLAAAMVPACVAVAISSLGAVLFRTTMTGQVDWWAAEDVLLNLAVNGVLGGLVLASVVLTVARLLRRLRWPGPRPPLVIAQVIAAVIGVGLVAGTGQLRLSPVSDLTQIGWVHETVNHEGSDARRQCRGDPVNEQGASQARAAIERLRQPSANPATIEVHRAHDRRLTMWEACAAAIDAALDGGRRTVTTEQRKQFVITDGGTVWLRQPSVCEMYTDLKISSPC